MTQVLQNFNIFIRIFFYELHYYFNVLAQQDRHTKIKFIKWEDPKV